MRQFFCAQIESIKGGNDIWPTIRDLSYAYLYSSTFLRIIYHISQHLGGRQLTLVDNFEPILADGFTYIQSSWSLKPTVSSD